MLKSSSNNTLIGGHMTTVIANTKSATTFGFDIHITIHSGGYQGNQRNVQIPYIHPDKFELTVQFIDENKFIIENTGTLPLIVYDHNPIRGILTTNILNNKDTVFTQNQENVFLTCPVFSQMGNPKLLTMRLKTWMSITGPCLTIYPEIN